MQDLLSIQDLKKCQTAAPLKEREAGARQGQIKICTTFLETQEHELWYLLKVIFDWSTSMIRIWWMDAVRNLAINWNDDGTIEELREAVCVWYIC